MKVNKLKVISFFSLLLAVFVLSPAAEAGLSHDAAHEVWGKIAVVTELTKLPFEIKEDKVPNAWVTNGSSVTVTTGLLNLLGTKDELYGVLAHEAGHAKLNHYESTVSKNVGLSIGAAVLGNLLGGGLGGAAVNVGANLAAAGFSREQEVAADDYAVKLAYENGENPVGLYSAMLKLSSYGGKLEPSGFNSHPPDDRRLLHIKNEILKYDPDAKFPEAKTDNEKKSDAGSSTAGSGDNGSDLKQNPVLAEPNP